MTDQIQADKDYFYANKHNFEAAQKKQPLKLLETSINKFKLGISIGLRTIPAIIVLAIFEVVLLVQYQTLPSAGQYLFWGLTLIWLFLILGIVGVLRMQAIAKQRLKQLSDHYQLVEAKITKFRFRFGHKLLFGIYNSNPRFRDKNTDTSYVEYEFTSPKSGKTLTGRLVYFYNQGHSFERNNSEVEKMSALVAYQSDELFELI